MAKRESIDISKIIKLLYTNGGVTRNGCYDLPSDILKISLNHFMITGENVIIQYDKIMYASWKVDNFGGYPEDELDYLIAFLNGYTFWKPNNFADDVIIAIRYNINFTIQENNKNNEYRKRRRVSILNNKKNRNLILTRDANKCSQCSSVKNLTIDHIVPIKHGGGDDIENLQTLCRPCNSKKGSKLNG